MWSPGGRQRDAGTGDRKGRPYRLLPFNQPLHKIQAYNPPVGSADSPLYTRGPFREAARRNRCCADALAQPSVGADSIRPQSRLRSGDNEKTVSP